jgi:hypothetical protein
VTVERTERERREGKGMSIEHTVKVTCDGCGKSVTYNFDLDRHDAFEPWFYLDVQVRVQRPSGQRPIREFQLDPHLHACSAACARKVLSTTKFSAPDGLDLESTRKARDA